MAADKETREIEIVLKAQQANASIKEMAAGVALMKNQLDKMAADDPRRQQLKGDFQQLSQRVGAARAEMRTYTQTEQQLREEQAKLVQQNQQVILNGQKLTATFNEMKGAATQLEKELHDLSGDDPARKRMLEDYQQLKGRIDGVKKELGEATTTGGFFKNMLSQAAGFFTGGGLLAAAQGIWGFFTTAREEFNAGNQYGAQLEATLKSTAHAAGLTADEIKQIGVEREKVTLFDDDTTNGASALLATFTNIKKGVFEEAVPAIQDLATKMAGNGPADLKGASVQVGKALNDPIMGITALSRVGVSFTEQQKEQIKAMVKAGDTAGAQKLILAELNKEFGGSAEAARKAAGGVGTLSLQYGRFKETVGEVVQNGLSTLSDWLQRIVDKSQPLIDIVVELGQEFASYYEDLLSVVQGLGLFTDAGDAAGFVVKALTFVLTLLVTPIKLSVQLVHALVDGFITLYNKSEVLRGVLGGLAATFVSAFTSIKDAALNILGGLGDLLIGIVTMDPAKIRAGFRRSLGAAADVAFNAGDRAARSFVEGYNNNKDKLITRKPKTADAPDEAGGGGLPAGAGQQDGYEQSKKEREAAAKKAAAAEKKALQERLNSVKEWVKEEGQVLQARNVLTLQLGDQAQTDQQKRRDQERQRVFDAADKKYDGLNQKDLDYTEQVQALMAERSLALRELQAKFDQEDARASDEKLKQQQQQLGAEADERVAQLELDRANGLLNEQAFEDAVFLVKQSAAAKELELLKQRFGVESAEYKKRHGEALKAEAEHVGKLKGQQDGLLKFEKGLQAAKKLLGADEVNALADAFGKKSVLYKAAMAAQKALAVTEVGINLFKQYAANAEAGAKISALAPPVSIALGTAYTFGTNALATVTAGVATAKILGFQRGGRTSGGGGSLLDTLGLQVRPDGQLIDGQGQQVAGLVHQNEYVIPEWMRADPEVVQAEQWLETRRLRGYAQGGATSEGGSQAPEGTPASRPAPAQEERLVQVLTALDQRLREVEKWPTSLEVVLDLLGLDRDLEKLKKVKSRSEIRPK